MEISEQIIREAPQIEAYKVGLLESAKKLAETPLQLPAYQTAGFTPMQQQSFSLAQQGIGSYSPYLQAGQQAMEAGLGTTGAGANMLYNFNVAPQFNQAQAMMGQAGEGVAGATRGYDPAMVSHFMNPYQQMVTQQALEQMRRQATIASQGQAAQAVQSGAFGGTREGVQRAEFERNVQDTMGQRAFQDYSANYAQAQQAAQQAFEAQQQRQMSGSQLYGQLGQGIGGKPVWSARLATGHQLGSARPAIRHAWRSAGGPWRSSAKDGPTGHQHPVVVGPAATAAVTGSAGCGTCHAAAAGDDAVPADILPVRHLQGRPVQPDFDHRFDSAQHKPACAGHRHGHFRVVCLHWRN